MTDLREQLREQVAEALHNWECGCGEPGDWDFWCQVRAITLQRAKLAVEVLAPLLERLHSAEEALRWYAALEDDAVPGLKPWLDKTRAHFARFAPDPDRGRDT